jgi:hypothetical protein
MARQVGLVSCAYAASACLHLCSSLPNGKRIVANTLNSTLSLSVVQTSQGNTPLTPLTESTAEQMRNGSFFGVRIFVVDEISMVTASVVSHIADRLRQLSLTHKNTTFGNFIFVACGDFRQLPPPTATPIYEAVVHNFMYDKGYVMFFLCSLFTSFHFC